MENSDSECFESADEEVRTDDEDTKSEPSVKDNIVRATEVPEKKLDTDTCENPNLHKTKRKDLRDNVKGDDENNVSKQDAPEKDGKDDENNVNIAGKNEPETINFWDESEDWGEGEKAEENAWNNDEWEPFEVAKPQTKTPEYNVWSSWGNWSSIISTATQGVSNLTQGITNVIETGIGIPDPEELAKINHTEQEKSDIKNTSFGLGNFVSGVSQITKFVESTGTKVISGGLDTLETIGKKTMEVLQDGDPGLKKKRAFLTIESNKPVLSQLLREAKEKADEENKILKERHLKIKNYETLFDDHQGLVHLEALEMLSRQCDIKLQTLLESYTDGALVDMQETMEQVKELCELPDEDDEEHPNLTDVGDKLCAAVAEINIPITYKKLMETCDECELWLDNLKLDVCDERELHQQAIETLAQLTAIAVQQFQKTGELLLVKEHRSTADEADSLVQLTTTLTSLVGLIAAKFSDKLNAKGSNSQNKEEINALITNVFFEAANSSSYIQDAFQLLIPVLQMGAV